MAIAGPNYGKFASIGLHCHIVATIWAPEPGGQIPVSAWLTKLAMLIHELNKELLLCVNSYSQPLLPFLPLVSLHAAKPLNRLAKSATRWLQTPKQTLKLSKLLLAKLLLKSKPVQTLLAPLLKKLRSKLKPPSKAKAKLKLLLSNSQTVSADLRSAKVA
ncbi:hypothetical protein [Erythrobacter rubeus]|uniref:Transposase n=1 Tax=Erythrobacter rubeus TaxID=2760803 RepID=A0ABR8KRT7_9SPHN|nr:hypothetical protein [Erythrobacter rubeus]MBD2843459.1 hypothetical protein [Erythrobacter rubeus]